MTIIVTGGAGFIGSNFVYYLLKKTSGYRIVVFDKLTYAGNLLSLKAAMCDPRVKFVKGDIADGRAVRRLYQQYKPIYVFNFAAESHVDRSIEGPETFVRTNVLGTFRMLEEARIYYGKLGKALKKKFRFLHISTDEVYGSLGKTGLFTEATPYTPNSPYSATKAGADHLVRAYHETYDLPVVLTNCSNNYGPYQFPEKLVPLMILNALEGKPLPVYGRGSNVRDWLYVEDHCDALWRAITRGKPGGKYNVGGNSERTNFQVVLALCNIPVLRGKGLGSYRSLIRFVEDRPGHDLRYAIDASKSRKKLGWKPKNSFESGLRKTVQWYLSHLDWCRKVQQGKYNRKRLGLLR
jgi:dTDP-glucose 4,6-dehydratase